MDGRIENGEWTTSGKVVAATDTDESMTISVAPGLRGVTVIRPQPGVDFLGLNDTDAIDGSATVTLLMRLEQLYIAPTSVSALTPKAKT